METGQIMPRDERVASDLWIGQRLRSFRKLSSMTLETAAEQVGLSASFLSRLEKGDRHPSIGVLLELSRIYNTTIGDLVGEQQGSKYHLVRASEGRPIRAHDGHYETISGLGPSAAITAMRLTLEAGSGDFRVSNRTTAHHHGEEWVFVLKGQVKIEVGGDLLVLGVGDSLHFEAQTPHRMTNSANTDAEVLVVSSGARKR